MRLWWLLIACLIALPVTAEVFTYVDAQGNRVYTDQPGSGNAKRVPLATSNRMSANPTGAAPVIAAKKTETKPLFHYDMLRILVPEPDATVRSSAGEIDRQRHQRTRPATGPSLPIAARRPTHRRTRPQPGVRPEQHRSRQPSTCPWKSSTSRAAPSNAPPTSRSTCCASPSRRSARSNPAPSPITANGRNARSKTNPKKKKIPSCVSSNAVQVCALYWCDRLHRTHIPTHFGSKVPAKAGRTPRKRASNARFRP